MCRQTTNDTVVIVGAGRAGLAATNLLAQESGVTVAVASLTQQQRRNIMQDHFLGDAVVLGRALSEFLERGSAELLDHYDSERRPVAKQVTSITYWLTEVATATVPEHFRAIRNGAVAGVNPVVCNWLAWRLSLLGQLGKEQRERTN